MNAAAAEKVLSETRTSLERVSSFDPRSLPRTETLGTSLDFSGAVFAAERVIGLFRRLPAGALDEFPENDLQTIRAQADQFFALWDSALTFSPNDVSSPSSARDQIIKQIEGQYQSIFQVLLPYISFAVARTVDFNRLESDGRAAVRSIQDQTDALVADIRQSQSQIEKTLDDVRKAAAEHGVSQQAIYFRNEAEAHQTQATVWLKWTIGSALFLAAYSLVSLFFHNIPWLKNDTTFDAVQIGASKLLIFRGSCLSSAHVRPKFYGAHAQRDRQSASAKRTSDLHQSGKRGWVTTGAGHRSNPRRV